MKNGDIVLELVIKYSDDAMEGIRKHGDGFVVLYKSYGDEFVQNYFKYGNDAVDAYVKYGDDAAKVLAGQSGFPNYIKLSEELGKNLDKEGYKIVDIKPSEIANREWADMGYDLPPIAENTKAYIVEAGKFSYSRVFLEGYNNPMSNFILRTDDIVGLSGEEIAQKYALPKVPNKVVLVEIPSETLLEVSIVGPQEAWGTIGGDVQYAIKYVDLNPEWFSHITDIK